MKTGKTNPARPTLVVIGAVPPPYHGVTVSTLRVLENLHKSEFRTVHLDTSDHRDMDNIGRLDFTNVFLALQGVAKLILICIKERPAIIFTPINSKLCFWRDGLFILTGKLIGRAAVVARLHEGGYLRRYYSSSGILTRRFIDTVLPRVDRALVLGDCFRSVFEPWLPAEKIVVVPNGTDFCPAPPSGNTEETRRNIRAVFLGNLIQQKGVVDVLRAVPDVVREIPTIEFQFAGAWWSFDDGQNRCAELVESLELARWVTFLGVVEREERERFLLDADIFVFPTYFEEEGHPIVVLEAMAAGLPVISTDHAAIPETVIDQVTGFIIPIKNPEALARRIVQLANSPKLRARMGRASRERFELHYTQERETRRIIEILNDCIAESRHAQELSSGWGAESPSGHPVRRLI